MISSSSSPPLGFIGIGSLGSSMVRGILRARLPLTVYDRRLDVCRPFEAEGATIAGSIQALAQRSRIVGICVVDDSQVEEVVAGTAGLLAHMAPGDVIVVHSTVSPHTCERLAALAQEKKIDLIDAAVSRGEGFDTGSMVVMAGGPEAAYERCMPMFRSYATVVRRLGDVGSGQVAKLVNNLMTYSHVALAHDAFRLCEALGVSSETMKDILRSASGRSAGIDSYLQRGAASYPTAAAQFCERVGALLAKDLWHVLALAERSGAPLGALEHTADRARALFAPALAKEGRGDAAI